MNVKVHYSNRDEDCRELGNLVENMLRPIDPLSLTGLSLHVTPSKWTGPEAALFYKTQRLAHFDIKADTLEMRVSYISNSKMGRLRTNFVYIPLATPGTIERIQDMVRKALKVYVRWSTKPSKPQPETESKRKKFRIAYRRR